MIDKPYVAEAQGVRLAVRLTPRGGRTGLDGVKEGADGRPVLQLRVEAPPVEGAANTALVALLAHALGLPRSAVTIRSGEHARTKLLHIAGDPAVLTAQLEAWIGASTILGA